jgi:hypothetical protein
MILGFYFADSKYGLNYRSVRGYAPIFRASVRDFMTSEDAFGLTIRGVPARHATPQEIQGGFDKFRAALVEAAKFKGTQIVLALDWMLWANEGLEDEVLEVIEHVIQLGLWERVIAIELDDEPGWTTEKAARVFEIYKSGLRQLKRQTPKYGAGIVENSHGILDTHGWRAFDWVGLEGYVDPPGDWDPKKNRQRLNTTMREQYAKLNDKPFLWVMQGYDRNGAWKDEYTLAALQADSFSLMRSKPFKDTILPFALIFAHSRPGGTKDHQVLGEIHKAYVYGTRTRMEIEEEGI